MLVWREAWERYSFSISLGMISGQRPLSGSRVARSSLLPFDSPSPPLWEGLAVRDDGEEV